VRTSERETRSCGVCMLRCRCVATFGCRWILQGERTLPTVDARPLCRRFFGHKSRCSARHESTAVRGGGRDSMLIGGSFLFSSHHQLGHLDPRVRHDREPPWHGHSGRPRVETVNSHLRRIQLSHPPPSPVVVRRADHHGSISARGRRHPAVLLHGVYHRRLRQPAGTQPPRCWLAFLERHIQSVANPTVARIASLC